MDSEWRERARVEIGTMKEFWTRKYEWCPAVEEGDDYVTLFLTLRRKKDPDHTYVLRLRYEKDFETAGRREAFVDPGNWDRQGSEFWPTDVRGFQPNRNPPSICLEGTYGFHSDLHTDRDGRIANLNRLLLEIQLCMNE